MPKWWLVSDDDLEEAREALRQAWRCHDYAKCRDALHSLESGMHETDAVPADYAEGKEPIP